MGKTQIISFGAIALFILGYFCVYNHAATIQNDIHTRVEQALDTQDTQHIVLEAQGRAIILMGEVASEKVKQQAEFLALETKGVRKVINKLKIATHEEKKHNTEINTEAESSNEPSNTNPEVKSSKKIIHKLQVAPLPDFSCQDDFNLLLQDNSIVFASNSDRIDPSSNDLLLGLVEVAKQCADTKIEIAGHTDSVGSDSYNLQLNQQRADSVMQYLIANGVDTNRLSAVGYGESEPIADNDSPEGMSMNRRIEFKVEGP